MILKDGFRFDFIMNVPRLSSVSNLSLAMVSRPLASISRTRWRGAAASPKCVPSNRAGTLWRTQRLGRPTARPEPYLTLVNALR